MSGSLNEGDVYAPGKHLACASSGRKLRTDETRCTIINDRDTISSVGAEVQRLEWPGIGPRWIERRETAEESGDVGCGVTSGDNQPIAAQMLPRHRIGPQNSVIERSAVPRSVINKEGRWDRESSWNGAWDLTW
ncbi:hypothetical protein HO173_006831 [Letharia columbiana]|uniref:Uncharacterized protein n=1 Tax=Letharia columbiana TaxID=112416 RepID=A0A8H6FU90_9LECA|nr:uncharacterized protein HO173_006831 [Letharia columbiana]KAF6234901.1 hypothetical protein HO173_006831 [Letharia columbiana]